MLTLLRRCSGYVVACGPAIVKRRCPWILVIDGRMEKQGGKVKRDIPSLNKKTPTAGAVATSHTEHIDILNLTVEAVHHNSSMLVCCLSQLPCCLNLYLSVMPQHADRLRRVMMFCLSDCDNAANRLSYYSDYENGSKMLVPFLQHVNVIHCNRLGSRKRFR
ncbi:hypothetical protein F2P81_002513, partial [Scophthalmus maximus]